MLLLGRCKRLMHACTLVFIVCTVYCTCIQECANIKTSLKAFKHLDYLTLSGLKVIEFNKIQGINPSL